MKYLGSQKILFSELLKEKKKEFCLELNKLKTYFVKIAKKTDTRQFD